MTIERNDFLKALKRVMPGVETGNVILEGADTFIFADGIFIRIMIIFPFLNSFCNYKQGRRKYVALKAKDFYDLISRLKGENFKLIPKSTEWIIKSGKCTS